MKYYKLNGQPGLDSETDGGSGAASFQQGFGSAPAYGQAGTFDNSSSQAPGAGADQAFGAAQEQTSPVQSTGPVLVGDLGLISQPPTPASPAAGSGTTGATPSVLGTTTTNIESSNWSGAVMTAPSGESFSTVSAQWVIPTIAQVPGVTTSDVAEWVGIDGYQSSDVCQAGVYEEAQTSNGQTTLSCQAWVEWYPADAEMIPLSSFDVNPGNTIKVTVETTGAGATEATFILDDETTGQTYETSLAAPSGTSLQGNSAEAIVETPELISGNGQESQPPLADFLNSPVTFDNVSATYSNGSVASLSSAQSIGMWTDNNDPPGVNGSVQEAYGTIQSGSDSVTVTENDYWGSSAPLGTVVVGDFTANGYDDLAYFNSSTSITTLQFLNGNTSTGGGEITNTPFEGLAGWTPVTAGDFTDNGYDDLVYYNASLGDTEIQLLNGTTGVGGGLLTDSPFENLPGWAPVAAGDFTDNGYDDLVFYNASLGDTEIQMLNGTTGVGGGLLTNSPFENLPGWTPVGVGDFTDNGYDDIVFYNASLGDTEIQMLNGTTGVGGGLLTNSPFENLPGWTPVGVGDFTGNGYDDLVFYNASLGIAEIQLLKGTTGEGGGEIANSPFEGNPSWTVVGVGDFTDNGLDDLIYYDASTGEYELQLLNGNTATSTEQIPSNTALADLGSSADSAAATDSGIDDFADESDALSTSIGAPPSGLATMNVVQPPAMVQAPADDNLGGVDSPMELPFSGGTTSLTGGNFSADSVLANAGQSRQSVGSAGGLSEIVPPMSSFFSTPAAMVDLSPGPSESGDATSIFGVNPLQHST